MKALKYSLYALLGLFVSLLIVSIALNLMEPSHDVWEGKTLSPDSTTETGGVTVTFIGNTNLLISDGATNLMIDGWFSRPSASSVLFGTVEPDKQAIKEALARLGVNELAAVIPVHSHYDHAMDAPEVARLTGATLVGSTSTRNIGLGWNLPDEQIMVPANGAAMQFGKFRVTLLKSKHYAFRGLVSLLVKPDETIDVPLNPPVKATDYKQGDAYSVLIEHESGSMLLQGSAGYVEGLLTQYDVDVLLLGVGGIAAQSTEYQDTYWRETVTATNPELIIGVHFDSLTAPLGDKPAFSAGLFAKLTGSSTHANLTYASKRANQAGIPFNLLPMWDKVQLLPLK